MDTELASQAALSLTGSCVAEVLSTSWDTLPALPGCLRLFSTPLRTFRQRSLSARRDTSAVPATGVGPGVPGFSWSAAVGSVLAGGLLGPGTGLPPRAEGIDGFSFDWAVPIAAESLRSSLDGGCKMGSPCPLCPEEGDALDGRMDAQTMG